MRLRPHRRNLVLLSSSAGLSRLGRRRPSRIRRARWWLRTGTFLLVIGLRRVACGTRARWEPVSLLAGVLLAAVGFATAAVGLFFLGVLVLIVALLKGIRQHGQGWQWPASERALRPGPRRPGDADA